MNKPDGRRLLIASRLREARDAAGLSQAQVAKQLGLHRPTVTEIEAGRRGVSTEELVEFARIYDVSVGWLAGEGVDEVDRGRDRIELAARQLGKLRPEDLNRLLKLITAIQGRKA